MLIVCAGACGAVVVGLVVVAFVADLETADRLGSITGAVAGLAGLLISLWLLLRPQGAAVEATAGGVAAGGDIGRIVTGSSNRFSTPPSSSSSVASPAAGSVKASGGGSVAAGHNIDQVITGDGNTL